MATEIVRLVLPEEVKLEDLPEEAWIASYGVPADARLPITRMPIPREKLTVGRKGAIYDVAIEVSPLMTPEKAEEAIRMLVSGLAKEFGIKTIAAKAFKDKICLQIMGSPFSWATLLAWLPTILALIGLTMVGVSVWNAIVSVPSWVWALLVIGTATFLIGPIIGEWILTEYEKGKGK